MRQTQKPNGDLDAADYRHLLVSVMNQAVDDYVKLQHPNARPRVYLQEAFLTAIDFLFDSEFRAENIMNGHNEPMSTLDLVREILDSDSESVERLQQYAINKCYRYWKQKQMPVLDHIPETVSIAGRTFDVQHAEGLEDYDYSIEENFILVDRHFDDINAQLFLEAIIDIIKALHKEEIEQAVEITDNKDNAETIVLARELCWVLKVNNCFSYLNTPDSSKLFLSSTTAEEL
jgi:hypothetical protein